MRIKHEKIKQLIKAKGSVEEFALRMRCKPAWLYYILEGKHSHTFKTVERIAKMLGCKAIDLIEE
jgi:transcriptional regulator with XRE-family HTH domain